MKLILENHPLFKDGLKTFFDGGKIGEQDESIEGGDIIVLSEKALAIGFSERTSQEAVKSVARKILKEGDQVNQGEEFGFIKFGSRVDVYVPVDTEVKVKVGDKTKGGSTVLAVLK